MAPGLANPLVVMEQFTKYPSYLATRWKGDYVTLVTLFTVVALPEQVLAHWPSLEIISLTLKYCFLSSFAYLSP